MPGEGALPLSTKRPEGFFDDSAAPPFIAIMFGQLFQTFPERFLLLVKLEQILHLKVDFRFQPCTGQGQFTLPTYLPDTINTMAGGCMVGITRAAISVTVIT